MNNLIRFYNQNIKKIWTIIIVFIMFIIVLRILNSISEKRNKENIKSFRDNINNKVINSDENVLDNRVINQNLSLTGEKVSSDKLDNAKKIFSMFYDYCNSKDLEHAYEMLTDECKQIVYSSLDSFEKNYYNNIFKGKNKTYFFENWFNNTYKVTVKESALSTGKATSNDDKIDYVTIVDNKLNISSYIGRTILNKENTKNDINIVVSSKDTFMDYEIYNITVNNYSNNEILLSDIKNSEDVYLRDSNGIKYGVYNHELLINSMKIKSKHKRNLNMKFYSSYTSRKKIESLIFDNIKINDEESIQYSINL